MKWTIRLAMACILAFSMATWSYAVNINTDDAQAISDGMKGVGIKKAEAIVIYRKDHGHFKSLEDLQMVKGIGEKTLEKNKNEIQF